MKKAWSEFFEQNLGSQPVETVRIARLAFRAGYEAGRDVYCNRKDLAEAARVQEPDQEIEKSVQCGSVKNQQDIDTQLILERLQ